MFFENELRGKSTGKLTDRGSRMQEAAIMQDNMDMACQGGVKSPDVGDVLSPLSLPAP